MEIGGDLIQLLFFKVTNQCIQGAVFSNTDVVKTILDSTKITKEEECCTRNDSIFW